MASLGGPAVLRDRLCGAAARPTPGGVNTAPRSRLAFRNKLQILTVLAMGSGWGLAGAGAGADQGAGGAPAAFSLFPLAAARAATAWPDREAARSAKHPRRAPATCGGPKPTC